MSPRILIVSEEPELRAWVRHHIEILYPEGDAEELDEAQLERRRERLQRESIDLLVLGARCESSPDKAAAGLELLRRLRRGPACPPVIVIATGGSELTAVRAMRLGAADYLPRAALSAPRLADTVRLTLRAARRRRLGARQPGRRHAILPAHLRVPHYSILHTLGESARAAVYLAHSSTLARNVALKISKPTVDGQEPQSGFEREYATIRALRHPSVVEIYDHGVHEGHEYIAMEYFPCGDLKVRLQQPLSVTESLEYAQRICAALQVVHAAGVLHRDLKPPNVMLREDSSIVLIDFGLAKLVDSATRSTAIGVLRGSPYYMSPEQAQGLDLDERSDLYSAGVILFEMLSGSKPYRGTSAIEVMQQHVHGTRPKLPPHCASLEGLIARFMARDPAERFAHADEACAALREAAHDVALQPTP